MAHQNSDCLMFNKWNTVKKKKTTFWQWPTNHYWQAADTLRDHGNCLQYCIASTPLFLIATASSWFFATRFWNGERRRRKRQKIKAPSRPSTSAYVAPTIKTNFVRSTTFGYQPISRQAQSRPGACFFTFVVLCQLVGVASYSAALIHFNLWSIFLRRGRDLHTHTLSLSLWNPGDKLVGQ